MDGWTATVELLRWPIAVIISSLVLSRGLVAIAKMALRVGITTRRPILISTGLQPLQAAVEKVRI